MLQRQDDFFTIFLHAWVCWKVSHHRSVLISGCARLILHTRTYVGMKYWCFPFNPWFSSECIADKVGTQLVPHTFSREAFTEIRQRSSSSHASTVVLSSLRAGQLQRHGGTFKEVSHSRNSASAAFLNGP